MSDFDAIHQSEAPGPLSLLADRHYGLLLLLIGLGYALLQLWLSFFLPLTYEEGLHLQVSRLMQQGYEPYTQIFTLTPPLFVWLMGWLGTFDLEPAGFRLPLAVFGLLFLLSTGWLARLLVDRRVSLASATLLATAVTFLAGAGLVTPVVPGLSVALFSLGLALLAVDQQPVWLVAAGVLWGTALFLSPAPFSLGPVTLLLIWWRSSRTSSRARFFRLAALWLAGGLVAGGVGLGLAGPAIVFDHLGASYVTLRANLAVNLQGNVQLVGQFLLFNFWLSVLAIYGLTQLYAKPDHPLWLVVIWGLVSFVWVGGQVSPGLADTAVLLPPLALLAGWGLVDLAGWPWRRLGPRWAVALIGALVGLYGLVSWHWFGEYLIREVDTADDLIQIQQRPRLAAFVRQYTPAESCVIVDDPALAIVADRLPTPQLVGLSQQRLAGGLMTDKELARLIEEGRCTALVLSKREYHQYFEGFGGWIDQHYPNQQKLIRTTIHYR